MHKKMIGIFVVFVLYGVGEFWGFKDCSVGKRF